MFDFKKPELTREQKRNCAGEALREIYEEELFAITPDLMEFEAMLKLMFQYDTAPIDGNQLLVKLPNGQNFLLTLTAEEVESDVPVF